jgi:hypothetical protein
MRRRREPPSPLLVPHAEFVWAPDTDGWTIATYEDILRFAFHLLPDAPVRDELLVLLDEDDTVVELLVDPTPALAMQLHRYETPYLRRPVTKVLLFRWRDQLYEGLPRQTDRDWFRINRNGFRCQGLTLVDMVDVSYDAVRTYAAQEASWDDRLEPWSPIP